MIPTMSIQEISDNAWDIGTVSGVLQGIALTAGLLDKQKEAIAIAIKAIGRIEDRNQRMVEEYAAGKKYLA